MLLINFFMITDYGWDLMLGINKMLSRAPAAQGVIWQSSSRDNHVVWRSSQSISQGQLNCPQLKMMNRISFTHCRAAINVDDLFYKCCCTVCFRYWSIQQCFSANNNTTFDAGIVKYYFIWEWLQHTIWLDENLSFFLPPPPIRACTHFFVGRVCRKWINGKLKQ